MKRSMLNQPMTYLAALALAAVGFAAQSCSSTKTTAKACSTNTDCEKGFICKDEVCAAAVTCETLKCESQGQTCITTKTESRCVTLGCRANADCTAPQVCVDSTCTVAPNTPVDSCEIMNSAFAFAPGAVVKIEVLALDASGNTIPY